MRPNIFFYCLAKKKENKFLWQIGKWIIISFYSDYISIKKTVSEIHNSFVVRAIIIFFIYTKTVFITSTEQIQKKTISQTVYQFLWSTSFNNLYVELRLVLRNIMSSVQYTWRIFFFFFKKIWTRKVKVTFFDIFFGVDKWTW